MAFAVPMSFMQPPIGWNALRQPLRQLLKRSPPAQTQRHGDATVYVGQGQPVIVFPVLGAGPESTAELRRVLDDAGFSTYDWGMGIDTGPRDMDLNSWLRKLEERVVDVSETEQSSVTLLGWSLGGIYARELAKRTNPLVRQVITLGTPFNTGADGQHNCMIIKSLERGYGRMTLNIRHRLRQSPPVPVTSIYSKCDGVVPWALSLEREGPQAENIEVRGATHRTLPRHPRALEAITHRLAQPEGQWRPFERDAAVN